MTPKQQQISCGILKKGMFVLKGLACAHHPAQRSNRRDHSFFQRGQSSGLLSKVVLLTYGSILVEKEFNCITQSFKHVDIISSFLMFWVFFLMDRNSNLKKINVFFFLISYSVFFSLNELIEETNEESTAILLAGKEILIKSFSKLK